MAFGVQVYSTATRHAKPHRQQAAALLLSEAVGPVGWPARSARSASAGATSKRVRVAPSRASTSPASAPDPRPGRAPRTRLREVEKSSDLPLGGADSKRRNSKGLPLWSFWSFRISSVRTTTSKPLLVCPYAAARSAGSGRAPESGTFAANFHQHGLLGHQPLSGRKEGEGDVQRMGMIATGWGVLTRRQ